MPLKRICKATGCCRLVDPSTGHKYCVEHQALERKEIEERKMQRPFYPNARHNVWPHLYNSPKWKTLRANRDVYHYLQVFDSIVRERIFIELAHRLKVPYGVVYLTWLNDPAGVKKTLVDFKNGVGEIGW